MEKSTIPEQLKDKIFEIKYNQDKTISKITSYFPLSESEQKQINSALNHMVLFHSIFTDNVSDEEWERTKDQIKKKFNDDLFEIDKP